jgi:hypothetical protein
MEKFPRASRVAAAGLEENCLQNRLCRIKNSLRTLINRLLNAGLPTGAKKK